MDYLPVELTESIVDLVGFDDVCALRLTNRALCAKASQGRFRSFYYPDKRLHLTTDGLRTLIAVTGEDGVARGLTRLTLVGICHAENSSTEQENETFKQIELLATAFRNIRANTAPKRLELLSLDVTVRLDGKDFVPTDAIGYSMMMVAGRATGSGYPAKKAVSPRAVWDTSKRTFQVALTALAQSRVAVEELRIFADVLHCSLACDDIVRSGSQDVGWSAFQQTRRLALSVSHSWPPRRPQLTFHEWCKQQEYRPTATEKREARLAGEYNAGKIVKFLAAFPNLEEVELQWYSLSDYKLSPEKLAERKFLQQLNETVRWPKLLTCTLVGFHTTAPPLMTFFKHHPDLTSVTLQGIFFPSRQRLGQMRPLLDHFARKKSKLEYLSFGEIWEKRRVLFHIDGEYGCVWTGERARQRVKGYLPPDPGPPPAEIENIWRLAESKRRYGPP